MSQSDENAGPRGPGSSSSQERMTSPPSGTYTTPPTGLPEPLTDSATTPLAVAPTSQPKTGLTPKAVVDRLMDPKKLINDAVDWFVELFDKHPRTFGLTAIGMLFAAMGLRAIGLDLMAFVPQITHIPTAIEQLPVIRDATWVGDLSDSRDCISKGKALGKKYVLLNLTQWIQYEEAPAKDKHVIEQRIVYTVLPLVDIADTDQVFAEDYQGSGSTDRWFGPRRETAMPGTNRYQVSFAGKKGVPITIVTGARMAFPQPFAPYRYAFRQKVGIAANNDFWVYENTEDVICSMTQVIDSKTLVLVPIDRGGHRIGEDGTHKEGDVMTQPPSKPALPNSALSITWSLVVPGEDVGLAFAW